ncbi:MAG TPA: DUF2812 domain-containing protein [Candidatus Mediterraneibacter norfolkensis]|nr:DUF2812 domain-containing protein [Candidatus Mediterraneibacter norfolkensis]
MKKQKRRTRRVFRNFGYLECGAFADYLHEMSLKGWHFREWRAGMLFEDGEPADITYCVEVFPKGSEMDIKPEEPAEEYAEYCRAAGWEFIDGERKFCIFRKKEEDAVPIVTEEERFANVTKAELRRLGSEMLTPLIVGVLFWLRAMGSEFADWMFSNVNLTLLLTMTVMISVRIIQCIGTVIWAVSGKRKLNSGRKIDYGKQHWQTIWNGVSVLFLAVIVLLLVVEDMAVEGIMLAVFVLLILGVSWGIAYFRPTRSGNWALQISVGVAAVFLMVMVAVILAVSVPEEESMETALAELPLTQSDYREMEGQPEWADYQYMESVLGTWLRGRVSYEEDLSDGEEEQSDTLRYDVYRSEQPWLLREVWQRETDRADVISGEAEIWGAQEVKRIGSGQGTGILYVRWSDAVLILQADVMPDEAQSRIIKEKLAL